MPRARGAARRAALPSVLPCLLAVLLLTGAPPPASGAGAVRASAPVAAGFPGVLPTRLIKHIGPYLNKRPWIRITHPGRCAVIDGTQSVTLRARAFDPDPIGPSGIAHVEFFANGTSLGIAAPDDCHMYGLATGDPMFNKDEDEVWKLAGLYYSVANIFILEDNNDIKFNAAIFEEGSLYIYKDTDGCNLVADKVDDIPSCFYSTRSSAHKDWITATVPEPSTAALVLLAAAASIAQRPRWRTTGGKVH